MELPDRAFRRLRWRGFLMVAALLLIQLAGATPVLAAGTAIHVTSTGHETAPFIADGDCTLGEAIAAANADAPVDGCTAANFGNGGPFFIYLGKNANYSLTAVDNQTDGANGLPSIRRTITIVGVNATIQRASNAPQFRLFHVAGGGNLTLDHLILRNGRATSSGASCNASNRSCGGALLNMGGTVTVIRSTISNNVAEAGGGIGSENGRLTVRESAILNNTAVGEGGQGGGIAYYGGPGLNLSNVTVASNSATFRGGGLQNEGLASVSQATFVGNSAALGGNIRNFSGNLTLANSILVNAVGGNCADGGDGVVFSSIGYNIEDRNDCRLTGPGDRQNTSPQLTTLQNNGGPTVTHALLPGSPAIDAIPVGANACAAATSVDQRGARRANGAGQGGPACDVGAYEFNSDSTVQAITLAAIGLAPTATPLAERVIRSGLLLTLVVTILLFVARQGHRRHRSP